MPRSTMDILASSCTAPARTREEIPPRHIRPNPKAMRSRTCGGVRSIGARRASGRWRRRRRRAWSHMVRDAAGRPVPLDRPRPELADAARAVEHPKRKQWMGGGADLRDPFDLRRSARFQPGVDRGIDRRHLVHRGCARVGRCGERECAPNMLRPSRRTTPSLRTCTAWCSALPRRAHVGAASQRHLRLLQ